MVKKIVLTLTVLACLVAVPRSATAGCTSKFGDCIIAANRQPTFWSQYAAFIDCELDLIECLRVALIGV
jgi:hypothetical protein